MSRTVLICDGSAFLRGMLARVLGGAGFRVAAEAATSAEAVERFLALRPELVTLDVVMPDVSGIEAVREIVRADPAARILMCSAIGQQALVREALEAGARDFVVKPFQPARVLEAVQRVLGGPARELQS